jgi:hypothetical protein
VDSAAYGQYRPAQAGQCLNYGVVVAVVVALVAALLVFQVEAAVTPERLYLDYLQETPLTARPFAAFYHSASQD